MSFDNVERSVLDDARKDAEKILSNARKECDELLARAREENKKKLEEALQQAEAAEARETSRQIGVARHDGRLAVLDAKNQVIDEVFKKTAEYLRSLGRDDYRNLLSGWIKSLSPEIGGTIRVNPKDSILFDDAFMKRINKGRAGQGLFTGVVPDPEISGGFMVEGDTYTVDFSLDSKLAELRRSVAGELAKELFES